MRMRWSQPRCDGSLLVIVVYCVTRVGVTTVLSTVVVMGWFRNMTLSHFSHLYNHQDSHSHLYSSDSVTVTVLVITLELKIVVKAAAGKPGAGSPARPGRRSWK